MLKRVGMKRFEEFQNEPCDDVYSINDINDKFDYEDKHGGGGSREWDLLSCGQDCSSNGYNELERFYETHLEDKVQGLGWHLTCIKALCECCHEIPNQQRTHDTFKVCVGQKLGIKLD